MTSQRTHGMAMGRGEAAADGWTGARWWTFDFHTHTPASDDYGKGPDQARLRKLSPREWLLDFMRAGIDCVVVTDHNTGQWVDRLKEANDRLRDEGPEGYRRLHLFPGVEINTHGGVHVLAVFDVDTKGSDVDRLLGAVGVSGHTAASLTTLTPVEVARTIHEHGGLAVPAHIDTERGALVELSGQSRVDLMECEWIVAAEAVNRNCLRRFEPVPPWSLVLGSDSHHRDGSSGDRHPGSHHTWIKMGRPSLEGLRLALIDGSPLSVLRSDEESGDPNEHASQVIESITIHHAQYAGRSRPLESRFSPWMSAIVGGRGTGKSTIVEMLRLTLRRQDDVPEEIREDLERFATVPRHRTDVGALTPNTECVVTLLKGEGRFRLHWREDGSGAAVEEQDGEGGWIPGAGEIRERFPIRILSQKQVLALSRNPNSLLQVIDDSPLVNRAEWDSRHEELQARFLRLRGELREADSRIRVRSRLLGELSDVDRQIAVFEEGGHRELLFAFGRQRKQQRVFRDRLEEMDDAERRLRELADDLGPSDVREDFFDDSREAESGALALLQKAVATHRALQLRLDGVANEFADAKENWRQEVAGSAWYRERRETADAYAALKERLQREGVDDVADYGRLVQQKHLIEGQLAGLDAIEEQRATILARATEVLSGIDEWRAELTRRRIAFCDGLLTGNELVRVSLVPLGDDPEAAEPEFRNRLDRTDGRLPKDILDDEGRSGMLAELYADAPGEPAHRITEMMDRVGRIKRQVVGIASGTDVPERTKWFHTHVRQLRPDQLAHFELWWPEDRLRVEYRRTDKSPFVSIIQGSPGQKSAAILALLLSHGDEPIVLDQPEDDLDNHVIHDLIVRQIHRDTSAAAPMRSGRCDRRNSPASSRSAGVRDSSVSTSRRLTLLHLTIWTVT